MSGGGDRERSGPASRRSVGINMTGLRSGIREAPAPNSGAARGRGGPAGERKMEAAAVEQKAAAVPESKGPSGVDTGGAGTDVVRTAAARLRRSRTARGGGLSNVIIGGTTLG
jgi:hypothetical protein